MLSKFQVRWLCIPPRCRICRFMIRDGEEVTAVTPENQRSTFAFGEEYFEKELQLLFQKCTIACNHYDGQATGCHTECFNISSQPSNPPLAAIFAATAHLYQPSAAEEARRQQCISSAIQNSLYCEYKEKLPKEICRMIAKHLISVHATLTVLTGVRNASFNVDLAKPMWATFITIDDVEYISSLSNVYISKSRLLWNEEFSTQDALYVSVDHVGVRNITRDIAVARSSTKCNASAWWHIVQLSQRSTKFDFDGLKLRTPPGSVSGTNVLWQDPLSPIEMERLAFHHISRCTDPRLIPLELNQPDTFGYSMCWSGNLLYIHAHRYKEKLDFYREFDARCKSLLWTFMPLYQGEFVKEVWLRKGKGFLSNAIALTTDQRRTLVMGSFPNSAWLSSIPWSCIAKLSTKCPDRIFFNHSLAGIQVLATPTLALNTDSRSPGPIMSSIRPCSGFYSAGSIFYSSCSMENVAEIVVCQTKDRAPPQVTGLLFRYMNGNQACVGNFRLDCTGRVLTRDETSRSLSIGFGRASNRSYVGQVEVSPPIGKSEFRWREFSWDGTLEWWFRVNETIIAHSNRVG
ncbi:hypothetical protein BGZ63DRAFT_518839 [Mariannaea sp. PMI_226]|nr:hypothetical protein BGZ63DRAFT_518839 [Mariannaea sp. PMI_226]